MVHAIQFSPKRVGSTFLQKAIDSHPDIMGIDEVFVNIAKKPGARKSGFVPFIRSDIREAGEYIREVIYKTYPDKSTIFKLMYNQITFHSGLIRFIKENDVPIIHLMRRNIVKQIISGLTAATTKHTPIPISPEQLYLLVKEADDLNNHWAEKLKKYIKLSLYYEDIIGETINDRTYVSEDINNEICNLFKVKHNKLFATTKKKNKDDISVYLPNIGSIKEYFEETKYGWMI